MVPRMFEVQLFAGCVGALQSALASGAFEPASSKQSHVSPTTSELVYVITSNVQAVALSLIRLLTQDDCPEPQSLLDALPTVLEAARCSHQVSELDARLACPCSLASTGARTIISRMC